jgi:hypothetical protein
MINLSKQRKTKYSYQLKLMSYPVGGVQDNTYDSKNDAFKWCAPESGYFVFVILPNCFFYSLTFSGEERIVIHFGAFMFDA